MFSYRAIIAQREAYQNTIQYQQDFKILFDRKHPDLTLEFGDFVALSVPQVKKGKVAKWQPRWIGPFRILRQTGPTNYEIVDAHPLCERPKHGEDVRVIGMCRARPSTISIPLQLFNEQQELEEEFHSAPSSQGEDPPPSPLRVIAPPITLSPIVPVPEPIVFQRLKTPEAVILPNAIVSESDTESDSSTSSLRRSARSRNPAKRFGFDEYVEQGSSRARCARSKRSSKKKENPIADMFKVVPGEKPDPNVDKPLPIPQQAMEVVQSDPDPTMLPVANGDIPFGISNL
ncbi:unnamed protein product [Orchesella dallaii]|uniref:Uncharacterized protein n=1 Tax=Orchesella dallaii TaxID=48710 RepID=A0ABP1PZM4_9HEXA